MTERETLFYALRLWLAKLVLPADHSISRPIREGEFVDIDVRGNDAFGI